MSDTTKIEWADSTFNPWIGCTKVSTAASGGGGCDGCYAAESTPVRVMRGKGIETWGPGAPRQRTSAEYWKQPLRWNEQPFVECMGCRWRGESRAAKLVENPAGFFPPAASARMCPGCGEPLLKEARRRVFCASLADVFDNEVDAGWRRDLFVLIARTPNLDWLLLTKRIGNAAAMIEHARGPAHPNSPKAWPFPLRPRGPLPNVWLGVTIVNQREADRDIPKLLETAAAVRFISYEPALGPLCLTELQQPGITRTWFDALRGRAGTLAGTRPFDCPRLDWVIAGGESGPHARPANPQWFRDLRDQCAAAEVPFLFKQNGEWVSVSEVAGPGAHHTFEDGRTVRRVGKKLAGRTLDGVAHTAFPRSSS